MNHTNILRGAAYNGHMPFFPLSEMKAVLKTKESQQDFESLYVAAKDALSSAILLGTAGHEYELSNSAAREETELQKNHLLEHLKSCYFIKHDSWANSVIESEQLDFERYDLLRSWDIETLVDAYIRFLKRLNYVHQFYSFRRALAKCEFAQWDKLLSEARTAAWSELSWDDLEKGYQENRSLFLDLEKQTSTSGGSKISKNASILLIEVIDKEYAAALKKEQRIMFPSDEHATFKAVLRNRALEACSTDFQAKKINYISKDYQRTRDLKSVQYCYPQLSKVKILEKASVVKDQIGERFLGRLTNRWARVIGVGAAVGAFMMSGLKKLQW